MRFCGQCATPLQAPAPEAIQTASEGKAERRQLTVMFCDLVESMTLSAHLDPEELREVIRAYQGACADEIRRYEGHIAQYLGDGLLVYFGYPVAHEDDAQRAVRSGLGIIAAMGRLNRRLEQDRGIRLAVRLGIHTGLVVVGDVGGGERREQLAIGETPNTAARLQALAVPDTVVISGVTHRLVQGYFSCHDLGSHPLKGVATPVQVYRVVGEHTVESRFEAAQQTGLTPLVGRVQEMALMMDRWHRAKEEEGQVVLVSGEPGIGKSRLIQALREHVADESHIRLRYQCSPYHTNSALHPVIDRLGRAARFERDDPSETKLDKLEAILAPCERPLTEVVPLLAALLSIPTGERYPALDVSPQRQKERTLEVLHEQVAGLAAQQPVLFILEDAHWIDPTSVEFLEAMVDRAQTARILMMITFRPEFMAPWEDYAHVTSLTLQRLSGDDGTTLIAGLTGGKALPADVRDQIVARTDGVPLFVEELTKTVLESGLLREEDDRYTVTGPVQSLAIPSTLQASLTARLDRLGPVKEVAQIGATIGREFSFELLAMVSPLGDAELQEALGRLVDSELIFSRGTPPDATYTFKHALVQDTAYEGLLRSQRRQWHARIAKVLEEEFPATAETEPEVVAHHYTEAGLNEQAISYWQRAGERAVARSAHVEAIGHLRKGLGVLQNLPGGPKQAEHDLKLHIALGPPLIATKGYGAAEVEEVYTQARELCREVGDTAQLCPILYGLWTYSTTRAEYETSRTLCEDLLNAAESVQDPACLLDAHVALSCTSFFVGEFDLAREHGKRGMTLYDPQLHRSHALQNPGVVCRTVNAVALWYLGYPERALARCHEMLRLARELAHPFSLVVALTWFAMLHQYRRDAQEAQALAKEAMAISSEQSFQNWLSVAGMVRGWALAEQGRQDKGRNQMSESAALAQAIGTRIWRPYGLFLRAEAYDKAGQAVDAQKTLAEALTVAEETGERYWEAELHRLKGALLLQGSTKDLTEAEFCFKQGLEVARRQQAKSLELRAAMSLSGLWRNQGKRTEAQDLLAPIYEWFTEGFDTADLREAKVLLEGLS